VLYREQQDRRIILLTVVRSRFEISMDWSAEAFATATAGVSGGLDPGPFDPAALKKSQMAALAASNIQDTPDPAGAGQKAEVSQQPWFEGSPTVVLDGNGTGRRLAVEDEPATLATDQYVLRRRETAGHRPPVAQWATSGLLTWSPETINKA